MNRCLKCGRIIGIRYHKCPTAAWNKGLKLPQFSGKNHFMYGKKMSDEVKKKISLSKIGKPSKNKGRKFTLEQRKKMSLRAKKSGQRPPSRKGIKYSLEQRIRMRSYLPSGEKCHFWKGGATNINSKIRGGFEIKLWREAVFKRDNWTCQECGERGIKLNAHHIKSFAHYPELRFEISNGITLCVACHKKTDSFLNKYK